MIPPDQNPPATTASGPPSRMAPVNAVVPDHELIRRIGGGSYGDVWLARNAVGTWRAVKVVFRDRFTDARPYEREFSGMKKFEPLSRSNEGFVDILQIGRNDEAGYFYYVMELADDAESARESNQYSVISNQSAGFERRPPLTTGHCLLNTGPAGLDPETYVPLTLSKALLQGGRLPVRECLELGLTLNLALAHLHRAGLIHRDIKPSNIIFVGGVPKLADIGLVIESSEARSYVGTEGFIPPEGPTSPQADLYSLGKVLYEAGMGKDRKDFPEPFTQIAEATDSEQLLEFNAILLKACAASVTERYQSAEQMNADLALLQGGGSVRQQQVMTRRLRVVQRVGLTMTLLAALVGVGWLWQARQTRAVRHLAEEKTALANENRERVVQLNTAMGLRQMDAAELGEAMLWFAASLRQMTGSTSQALTEMERFRLTNLLLSHPLPVAELPVAEQAPPQKTGWGSLFKVSGDGRRIVRAAMSGIEVWEIAVPPHRLAVLPYHSTNSHAFATSTDGRRILINDSSTPPRVWTVGDDGRALVQELGTSTVNRIEIVPDEGWCVAIGHSGSLKRFPVDARESMERFEPERIGRWTSTFSLDGKFMGARFTNHLVRIFDTKTARMTGEFTLGSKWTTVIPVGDGRLALAWSPRIQTTLSEPHLRYRAQLFDVRTGTPVGRTIEHGRVIFVNDFDRNGRMMITGSQDDTARVWSLETGDPLSPVLRHSSRVVAVAMSKDATRVATGDARGDVRVWDIRTGQALTPPLAHGKKWAHCLAFALGDSLLVTEDSMGLIRFWDLARPGLKTFQLGDDHGSQFDVVNFKLSPDGDRLAVSSRGQIKLWDTHNWSRVASLPTSPGLIADRLQFTRDGRYLAFRQESNTVRVADARTLSALGGMLQHGSAKVRYAWSPDGKRLATAGSDGSVRIWNWRTGLQDQLPLQQAPGEASVVWLPKGDRLLTSVRIGPNFGQHEGQWRDLDSGSAVGERIELEPSSIALFEGTPSSAEQVRWAYVGADKVVRIQSALGVDISRIPIHITQDTPTELEFSPDGRRLAVACQNDVAIHDVVSGRATTIFRDPLQTEQVTGIGFDDEGRKLGVWRWDEGRLWDAFRGEPLTVGTKHSSPIRAGDLHPKARFMVLVSQGEQVVIQQYDPALSGNVLAELTGLVTGQKIGSTGLVEDISTSELVASGRQIKGELPSLFSFPSDRRALWHERQVRDSGPLYSIRRSLYHLDQLIGLKPDKDGLKERRAAIASRLVVARDFTAPRNLIDLTRYYTHSLDSYENGKLAGLRRGVHRLAGTEFDLRGVIGLEHPVLASLEIVPGERVSHIPVALRCERIHFLHAVRRGQGVDGHEAARWNIHYGDGSQTVQTMILGKHLDDFQDGRPNHSATNSVVAWERDPPNTGGQRAVRLYKTTWENPEPDKEVASLGFEASYFRCNPFVVAITVE